MTDLTARAFQIADEAMEELLKCHTRQIDACDPTLRELSDGEGRMVKCMENADPAIREAFEWLKLRGRAKLICGADGGCILLKEARNG